MRKHPQEVVARGLAAVRLDQPCGFPRGIAERPLNGHRSFALRIQDFEPDARCGGETASTRRKFV